MNPTTPQATPQAADTRFQKGNRGGPGNPYARQCAQFRQALHEMVTKDDIQDLACDLLRMAKGGSLAAMKLLFAYVIGKPTPAPDPDRVELEDWKLLQEEVQHTPEEVQAAFHGQPVSTWTGPARVALDVNRARVQADMLEQVGQHAEAAALRQEKLGRPDDPMANKSSGPAAAAPPPRPAYDAAGRPPMTNAVAPAPAGGGQARTAGNHGLPDWILERPDAADWIEAFSDDDAPPRTNGNAGSVPPLANGISPHAEEDGIVQAVRLLCGGQN